MINIQEVQPTSNPPLAVVKSFPIPPQGGVFCFSPVSFHASFVSGGGVAIFDVQDSKVLLQAKPTQGYYMTPCHFSPDGHFFACGIQDNKITIWENISDGYILWGSLTARFQWQKFSWSPTSMSILCWSSQGIQLLHLDHSLDTVPPKEFRKITGHLVAYPADQAYVATAQERGHTITVLNLSDATQSSIDTNMYIMDMKIVGNTIFVTDGERLVNWHLTSGGQADSIGYTRRENKAIYAHIGGVPVLSHDCAQIAFDINGTVFLYDIESQEVLGDLKIDGYVYHMQFSPNGCQLWFIVAYYDKKDYKSYCVDLERAENPCFSNVTMRHLEEQWSLDTIFQPSHEYCIIGSGSEWVSDSRGNLLWLPPNWRSVHGVSTRWDSSFLTLVSGVHPEPIIIEFQS